MPVQLPTPDTINKLRTGADQSFAMLAGMQLDVFTPLKDRPMSLEELAKALEVRPVKTNGREAMALNRIWLRRLAK